MRKRAMVRAVALLAVSVSVVAVSGLASASGSARPRYTTAPVWVADGAPSGFFGSQQVGPNVNITNKAGAQSETTVAVDPTNRKHMIASANDLSDTTIVYESFDGGLTWSDAGLDLGGTFCYDPWVDFNAAGDEFFTYECAGGTIQRVAYRKVGQANWTQINLPMAGGFPDRDMIVVDTVPSSPNFNHVYIGYDDAAANNSAYILKSNDGFANWTRSPKINDASATIGVNVATLPNGTITAVWEDFSGRKVMVDRSTDGGVTWSTDDIVTNYRLMTAGFFICIPPQPQRCVVPMPFSDADTSTGPFGGRLYVTYPDKDPAAAHWNTYVRYSDDAGQTWSPEIKVNDDGGTAYQFFPAISVAGDGTVGISWYDTRNDPMNKKTDRYWSYSRDGGNTWSANEKITSAPSDASGAGDPNDYGDYEGIDAFPGNRRAQFANVWADLRVGGIAEEMFFARVRP